LFALSSRSKTKMVWEICRNVWKISCAAPLQSAKLAGYWTVRRRRRFGYVASIGLTITNRQSPFTDHFSRPR
jgi:hypothetical protein